MFSSRLRLKITTSKTCFRSTKQLLTFIAVRQFCCRQVPKPDEYDNFDFTVVPEINQKEPREISHQRDGQTIESEGEPLEKLKRFQQKPSRRLEAKSLEEPV